jgi:hypothetical protein
VLDAGANFPGQLAVTKILQFNRHSHRIPILPTAFSLFVQTGPDAQNGALKP